MTFPPASADDLHSIGSGYFQIELTALVSAFDMQFAVWSRDISFCEPQAAEFWRNTHPAVTILYGNDAKHLLDKEWNDACRPTMAKAVSITFVTKPPIVAMYIAFSRTGQTVNRTYIRLYGIWDHAAGT